MGGWECYGVCVVDARRSATGKRKVQDNLGRAVRVCVCVEKARERERERQSGAQVVGRYCMINLEARVDAILFPRQT
jgi:hypothetical protein